jgi:muramoyltetrapeptide carboxypeptidase
MTESPLPNQLVALPSVPGNAGISVISPASFANADPIQNGLKKLSALGFAPRLSALAQARGPLFFAGTPEQRITDLYAAFADPDTSIVACVRGGYGSNYLLPVLELDSIRKHPKPFFAYSDLTGIQLRLLDHLGLPTFHGPMVAADFALSDGVHLPSFQSALAGVPYSLGMSEGLRTLKPGKANGIFYGGCLSILVSLLGTPWEPAIEGKLLFLEDIGVKPYQVDRMLWQLRQAGKLEGIRGVIFGEMLDCASPGASPQLLEEVILYFFSDIDIPIAIGLRSGHVSRQNVTLIFGVEAELRATDDAQLQFLQPAVAS